MRIGRPRKIPAFNAYGELPPGVHWARWFDFESRFATNPNRRWLLDGLKNAILSLRIAGCQAIYVDGSFVTKKGIPNDYDACWEADGVDPYKLDRVFLVYGNHRAAQKGKYRGEWFCTESRETDSQLSFLGTFQVNYQTGRQKGIIALDIRRTP